jgi:hypothetical protein
VNYYSLGKFKCAAVVVKTGGYFPYRLLPPANSFFFGLMLSKLSLIDPAEFLENPQFCVPTQEYGFTPENQVELSLE